MDALLPGPHSVATEVYVTRRAYQRVRPYDNRTTKLSRIP